MPESVEVEISRNLSTALAKRKGRITGETNAFRLVDGAADGFPGLCIDDFAGHWIAQTKGAPLPAGLPKCGRFESLWWKRLAKDEKQAPELVAGNAPDSPLLVRENGLAFEIDTAAGYSCGLFLDQRDNRIRVHENSRPGRRVLNTFAYTCGFSVAAAAAGAETTSADLSGNYLDWGRRNFEHNQLDPTAHHFAKGDVFERLRFFAKKGILFHGIVLDPPTFSRSKESGAFRVEKDYGQLLQSAVSCLEQEGWILCCANTHRLVSDAFEAEVKAITRGRFEIKSLPMPADFRGSHYLKSVWLQR